MLNIVSANNVIKKLRTGPYGSSLKSSHWREHGTPVITIGCLGENEFNESELLYIDNEYANELSSYKVVKGDIVFSRVADIGRAKLITKAENGWVISSNLMKMTIDQKIALPEFIYISILYSPVILMQLRKYTNGGARLLVTSSIIKKLKFPLPEIQVQKSTTKVIKDWNSVISILDKLVEAKKMNHAWLVNRLITNSIDQRCHLRDISKEISNRNSDSKINIVLTVSNKKGFILPEEQFERQVASSDLSNYKIVRKGQYAYNPSRINVGSIARLDDREQGVLSPMYVVFELEENKVNSDFFLHWLSSSEAKQRIRNSAQGSVRESVSFGDFGAIPFPLPSLKQQKKIADVLNTAQLEIELLKKQADLYRKQKKGLMQKLLTGEWRVK